MKGGEVLASHPMMTNTGRGRSFACGGTSGRGVGFARGGFVCHRCHRPISARWDGDSDSDSNTDYEATFDVMKQFTKKNIYIRLVGRHLAVETEGKARQTSPHPYLERSSLWNTISYQRVPIGAKCLPI